MGGYLLMCSISSVSDRHYLVSGGLAFLGLHGRLMASVIAVQYP
jgi:hypothetical protein